MLGRCYKKAVEAVMEDPSLTLCHGVCTGLGGNALGKRYGHAWVEHNNIARDVKTDISLSAELFRFYGQAYPVITYTYDDMMQMVFLHENYGPWHPQIRLAEHEPQD